MEIPSTRFDMTDPFAHVKSQIKQAQTLLRTLPQVQQQQLIAQWQASLPARCSSPEVQGRVKMIDVKTDDWDGERAARPAAPMQLRRPHRRSVPLPWQWVLLVAACRLERGLNRWARQQKRQAIKRLRKLQRQLLRHLQRRQLRQQIARQSQSTGPSWPVTHAGGASALMRQRQTTN